MFLYDSPPPNRRLHEPENQDYSPLQVAKLGKKCVIDLHLFTIIINSVHMNRSDQQTTSPNIILRYYILRYVIFDGVGGSGVGWDRHRGWAEVHDRVEETRSRQRD